MITLGAGSTDRQLLYQYVHDQDPEAFKDLVRRHGAAVHRTCRGVLKDIHEAEDAFQATFLVLARRAAEIRDPEALGGWLRGVAHRVAIRARRQSARRREVERTGGGMPVGEPTAPRGPDGELRELIGEELTRLPDDYRQPIVLCYLDGLTHQEAAHRLNWPVGTVKVRLVRGRRILRERLDRRGVALGAGLLLLLGSDRRAHAATGLRIEAAARAMALESAGRRAALDREYPRVLELANAADGQGELLKYSWPWAAVLVIVALAVLGPVAWALGGSMDPEIDPSTLPSNLTDVLNVECR